MPEQLLGTLIFGKNKLKVFGKIFEASIIFVIKGGLLACPEKMFGANTLAYFTQPLLTIKKFHNIVKVISLFPFSLMAGQFKLKFIVATFFRLV